MDKHAIQEFLNSIHIKQPTATEHDCSSLCILFQDGEIGMTKAGSLWQQRNVHTDTCSSPTPCKIELEWPAKWGKHGCFIFKYDELKKVQAVRKEMFGEPLSEMEAWRAGLITIMGFTFAEAEAMRIADEAKNLQG